MKKPFVLLTIILLFPLLVSAAHVYIWNYDILDTFYDSQVGATINCAYWIEQSLTANNHTFQTGTSLPANLDPYDVVFVTLGWFRC